MGWQIVAEFHDAKSGKSLDRPGLKKMMEAASRREFDVLVFWSLDRLSRSGVLDVLMLLSRSQSGESASVLMRSTIWTRWGRSAM